jgi:tRNA(adenine34) deaminase
MTIRHRAALTQKELDERVMRIALEEAERAAQNGEVPVGAVLMKEGEVLARDHNRCIELNDPSAHAEILVLRKAGTILGNYRLNDTTLYVTAEPCPMCASALIHGRVSRLVFGALEPKFGAVKSRMELLKEKMFNHRVRVEEGILEEKCADALKAFFREKRKKRVRRPEVASNRHGRGE